MAGNVYHYQDLTAPQLGQLDPARTIVLMALSPLEVHGPHLPLGTDVFVAEDVRDRVLRRLGERWPELDLLVLPSVFAGADPIPARGSVAVDSRAIYYLLESTGRSLAGQGFRYLVLTDNHGGTRHQIAIERAVRRLYRRQRFYLIAPFLTLYRKMVEHDPALLAKTGTAPRSCGDIDDAHSGRNETSLMLAVAPARVLSAWKELPGVVVDRDTSINRQLRRLASLVRLLGGAVMARDLEYAGVGLSWFQMKPMPTYVGEPALATPEAGARMLDAHADEAVRLLERAMQGEPPYSTPLVWGLRFLLGAR